jgi:ribonucleoside-diphosphate reductase alpha chain
MESSIITNAGNDGAALIQRYFTEDGRTPESYFEWGPRDVQIKDGRTENLLYDGKKLNVITSWSDLAIRVVGSKYFYRGDGPESLENGLDVLIGRVSKSIAGKAVAQGVIPKEDETKYRDELAFTAYNQGWSANSPVWFNVGLHETHGVTESERAHSHWAYDGKGGFTNDIDAYEIPQAAACFIQSITDSLPDIMDHAAREAMLFKFGSGTGTNFGPLRGVNEPLSGGGYASGQISFLRIYDIIAGSVQSGGKTRRAAKMLIQPDDHPDLIRFINWKAHEEKKALWLSANTRWAARYAGDLEGEAHKSVTGQNGNNSIRLTDEFMEAALRGEEWDLNFRTANRINEEVELSPDDYRDDPYLPDKRFIKKLTNKRKVVNAGEVLELIARAAAVTGDPAVQYDGAINRWNTVPNFGRIVASNPCSEFMAPDDTACNLASINLTRFSPNNTQQNYQGEDILDLAAFRQVVRNSIVAQETLVDSTSYPAEKIARNSHSLRPLGLGYTNLGALLMENGLAYDSDEGRALASAVTSLMTAYAYQTSTEIAENLGPFEEFGNNKDPMLNVIRMHKEHTQKIQRHDGLKGLDAIIDEAEKVWENVLERGDQYGFRNSQVTLLAPTGTIGFMMDVDCTGVEPMPAMTYHKGLAGGGELAIELKPCVKRGLEKLGYNGSKLEDIMHHIVTEETIIGAPGLKSEHYNVFATAMGDNTIDVKGHLNMMAAVQPFLSGAISKTVNLPKGATIQEVRDTYTEGWKLGLKSVSLYVDGTKGIQPINIKSKKETDGGLVWGDRDKPINSMMEGGSIERAGWNISVGGTGVHLMVGEYDDRPPKNSPADFFVAFGSAGSPFSSSYTSWSKELSRNRQRGMPLTELIKHNQGATGTISGFTDHPFIKSCSSIEDLFAKLVQLEYLGDTSRCDVKPTPGQLKELRCNVLAQRRRNRHHQSRIDFIETAMETGELTSIFPLYEDEVEQGEVSSMELFCVKCGHATILSGANCRKCNNCGEAGGCG